MVSSAMLLAVAVALSPARMIAAPPGEGLVTDGEKSAEVGYVTSVEATVHCAPSLEQYVCDRLTRGQRVEVHVRRGDWYGIRPTAGCFSWIHRDGVSVADDGTDDGTTAVVTNPDTKVWIGSAAPVEQHYSQLRLNVGDQVALLDTEYDRQGSAVKSPAGADRQAWLRIKPPVGELRWIHERFVHIPLSDASSNALQAHPSAAARPPRDSRTRSDATERGDASDVTATTDDWSRRRRPADGLTRGQLRLGNSFAESMQQLRLAVARTMTEPIDTWDIEDLAARLEKIRKQSQSTWDRARLARLEESISELSDMQQQHRSLATQALAERPQPEQDTSRPRPLDEDRLVRVAEPIRLANDRMEQAAASRPEDDDHSESYRAHYTAVGRLMRIRTSKSKSPPFGLVNADGRLLTLVTPTPGYNIRPYIGRKIGVMGSVQTVRVGAEPYSHIVASKAILLDREQATLPLNMANLPWIRR